MNPEIAKWKYMSESLVVDTNSSINPTKTTKKCAVGYKTAHMENSRFQWGGTFDKLDSCCVEFRKAFFSGGNQKHDRWENPCVYDSGNAGINFVTRGELVLLLGDIPMKYCPFCSAPIEIRCTKEVLLKERLKIVPDGYIECDQLKKGT